MVSLIFFQLYLKSSQHTVHRNIALISQCAGCIFSHVLHEILTKGTSQFRSPEEIQPDLTVQSASREQQSTARLTRFPSDLLESSVDPQPSAAAAAQAAQAVAAAAAQADHALYQAAEEGKYGCGMFRLFL